ncbi:MAG: 2-succinyl-5-enolpyruvyl-6-hydroxy-3-cyclohexene-1-carboxylic-acid synthase [Dehalococcoidia bacterium]|nr:MAG: 2-succinyl-5-enolpyruvyl-6-hydroxy-3-cyclohexene-1-carboxylic-acid synthase [Dehalococcoidia bacterium]
MTGTRDALDVSAGAFVDELACAGVRHVVVCPGSRSTPLTMLLDAHPGIRVWMHLDERSAAYFALGMAKASREPVSVLATSGTATVNFAPAVVEAYYAKVPLIVLTADRPPELRGVGAPQTIDQLRLYGPHAKWSVDMPLPESTDEAARHWRLVAARAAATAIEAPRGPVHVNFPFREPLIPAMADAPSSGRAAAHVTPAPRRPHPDDVEAIARELRELRRGIIVCGPGDDPALPDAVASLGRALGYPVLADPLSGVRCGPHDRALVVSAYDALLRDPRAVEELRPEAVLRFGAQPTSKPLVTLLRACEDARQIIIDGDGGWTEPFPASTQLVRADAAPFCEALAAAACVDADERWVRAWTSADGAARAAIASHLRDGEELSEPAVIADLAAELPDGAAVFAGNSMPVRDLDSFFAASGAGVRFMANRGASGIDGVVSSALGAASVAGPLVLVVGDLSFYHDMNGLLAAKRHAIDGTIVLVNNDGGGIFSFLPQAAHPERFEELFGMPHGLDFAAAAAVYGIEFVRARNRRHFREELARSIASPGVQIIEVRTERAANVDAHRAIWRAVADAVDAELAR